MVMPPLNSHVFFPCSNKPQKNPQIIGSLVGQGFLWVRGQARIPADGTTTRDFYHRAVAMVGHGQLEIHTIIIIMYMI